MNGHQSDEGPVFTAPYIDDNASFSLFVQGLVPSAKTQDIYYITNTLYPAIFNGTLPYGDQLSRAILFVSEYIITCKSNMLDRAFKNDTYGYVFSVPPGVHAQDTQYTFYNGPGTSDLYGTYNASVAVALQQYITSFAITGTPDGGPDFPAFPPYRTGTVLNLTTSGFPSVLDPTANERCLYWQQEPYKANTASGTTQPATNGSSMFWRGEMWKTVGALLASLIVL